MTAKAYATYGAQFAGIYDDLFPQNTITDNDIAWLTSHLPRTPGRVVELGAGTGRVAIPLAKHLADTDALERFHAVDISPEMVARLDERNTGSIIPVVADITTWTPPADNDLILCVCATLPMILDPAQQRATIDAAARSLAPGGRLIIEVHHDAFVRNLHNQTPDAVIAVPYPGHRQVLVSFMHLEDPHWDVEHRWIDGTQMIIAAERSRLTAVDELTSWSTDSGLHRIGVHGSLSGTPLEPTSPVAVVVFERPTDP